MAHYARGRRVRASIGPMITWYEYYKLRIRIHELEGQNAALRAQREAAQRALTKVMEQFREDRGWWDAQEERNTELIVTMLDLHPDLRTAPEVCAVLAKGKEE